MSSLISLRNANFKYNIDPVLKDLSFSVNSGDQIAIVGHNGCGKSTLLHILSGEITHFEGERILKRGLRFEVVEQYLKDELREYSLIEALMEKFPENEREYQRYQAEVLLLDLYFTERDFETKVGDLSGGGQNRLMFARAIILEPELVFMDEPTNHLDLKSLLYIEDYLNQKAKFAFVIISHDKTFLENVTNKTVILRDNTSYSFNLSYEKALVELERADEIALKRLELEEKEISRIKKSAKRLAIWGRTYDNEDLSKKAKSMEKRAEILEGEKTFVTRGNPYELDLNPVPMNSKLALQFHDFDVFYGDKPRDDKANHLFSINEFYMNSGEKLALLGDNGMGKSTFINLILKNLSQDRQDQQFKSAPNLSYGLYDQEQMILEPRETLRESITRLCDVTSTVVKNTLITAGFHYDRHDVKVSTLSGGEKSRIIFCVLNLNTPNFLILDEPTNHIDLDGKNELVASLKKSKTTALITGHDRFFIEEVADRFVMIDQGRLVELDDPSEFYENLRGNEVLKSDKPEAKKEIEIAKILEDEEQILETIFELEQKLEADLERKAKFQKPLKQDEWRDEIKSLYKKLD